MATLTLSRNPAIRAFTGSSRPSPNEAKFFKNFQSVWNKIPNPTQRKPEIPMNRGGTPTVFQSILDGKKRAIPKF
jgi:hypothetical protein